MSIAPLVSDNDQDLADWQSGAQAFYLEAAAHVVRQFCGWHIAPSITLVDRRCWFGERGLIMLPSTHVTAVSSVTVDGQVLEADCQYWWDAPQPWLSHKLFWPRDHFALVSFEHGYTETPPDVKAVVFEVMATAMELPASNASKVQTMQYNFELNPDIGVALSARQQDRLSSYKIMKFGGSAR